MWATRNTSAGKFNWVWEIQISRYRQIDPVRQRWVEVITTVIAKYGRIVKLDFFIIGIGCKSIVVEVLFVDWRLRRIKRKRWILKDSASIYFKLFSLIHVSIYYIFEYNLSKLS